MAQEAKPFLVTTGEVGVGGKSVSMTAVGVCCFPGKVLQGKDEQFPQSTFHSVTFGKYLQGDVKNNSQLLSLNYRNGARSCIVTGQEYSSQLFKNANNSDASDSFSFNFSGHHNMGIQISTDKQ